MRWNWSRIWKMTEQGLIFGLFAGMLAGVPWGGFGFFSGLILGLIFGLVRAVVGGFTDSVNRETESPNQGVKLSLKNSLAVSLVTGLTVGTILYLVLGIDLGVIRIGRELGLYDTRDSFIIVLPVGLIAGLIAGLNRGGSAVIKHYALRVTLALHGSTPLNLVKFLDHCAKLILLKKVGGGYIFTHRMLLDYFADLPTTKKSDESKRT
jgi:hypothetical protein